MYDPSEALLQLGLYDYVWGNPSLLQTYNANVQAAKAREEQNAYNMLWKQIEEKKVAAEKAKADELARKEKDARLAELYKQYNNAAGEQERALIRRQINTLEGSNDVKNEMLDAYDADKKAAAAEAEKEAIRHSEALKEMAKINKILRTAKKPEAKEKLAQSIYTDRETYPAMNQAERDKMYAEVMGLKTLGEKINDATESAAASHAGKKTTEALEEKDLATQASEAIRLGTPPSALDEKVRNKIREMKYTWNGQWRQR